MAAADDRNHGGKLSSSIAQPLFLRMTRGKVVGYNTDSERRGSP